MSLQPTPQKFLLDAVFSIERVVLADFSADAKMIEASKSAVSAAALKDSSLGQLFEFIQASVKAYRERLREVGQVKRLLQLGVHPALWQRLQRRLYALLRHHALFVRLHFLARDMAHQFEEVSSNTLEELKLTRAMKRTDLNSSSIAKDEIHQRVGGETTIVYAGRKPTALVQNEEQIRV